MASSSTSKIQPSSFGGYGRQKGPYGGLAGVEFAAKCPPDIQKGTRIIAVCGIPGHMAGPAEDGWFFSDTFLFWQMLQSRQELPNQLWLMSASPKDLIKNYGRYLHGPADGDRRVVMNEAMLPADEFKAGFRIFKPEDLLERFLAILKSEISEAARNKQPVLVFIFGHGEIETASIFIGYDPAVPNQKMKSDLTDAMAATSLKASRSKLVEERLAAVLNRKVQTTLVLTSCYSGGWVMKPNWNETFERKPMFNHSFLTAAGRENVSASWDISNSVGRQAGGSVFATCLIQSIITASDETTDSYDGTRNPSGNLVKVKVDNRGEELSASPSMAALSAQIVYECEARQGTLWGQHNFSFAVQDDLWANGWSERTGLPLTQYRERWEKLPTAPEGTKVHDEGGNFTGSSLSRTPKALQNIVRTKAVEYMSSKPGSDTSGCNTNCHPGFRQLIRGVEIPFNRLFALNNILDYRHSQIVLAEVYCEFLKIDVPENRQLHGFDPDEWVGTKLGEKVHQSKEISTAAANVLARFNTIKSHLIRKQIFDPPLHYQGFSFMKPISYLACILAEGSMSMDDIIKKLESLQQYKLEEARRVARSPLGQEILNGNRVKTLRRSLYETVGRLTHRMRSLSPHKKSPKEAMGS